MHPCALEFSERKCRSVLRKGLAKSGHQILISDRTPHSGKYDLWKHEVGNSGDIASFAEATQFGEVIIAALPWAHMKEVIETIEPVYLKTKRLLM